MMRSGTLAMFDALGFRRIWSRHDVKEDPGRVMRKLVASERSALEFINNDFGSIERAIANPGNQLADLNVAFLSDTIVVGVSPKTPEQLAEAGVPFSFQWSMLVACRFANAIQRAAAESPPALAYRGCITYGEFDIQGNFLIGPAIDEAAELMGLAQGAFTWLTSSAVERLEPVKSNHSLLASHGIVPYGVPLKGGDIFETFTVCPFDWDGTQESHATVASAILGTFVGPLDIEIKKQNTKRYFARVSRDLCCMRWPTPRGPL
jgi:hypothetical protein